MGREQGWRGTQMLLKWAIPSKQGPRRTVGLQRRTAQTHVGESGTAAWRKWHLRWGLEGGKTWKKVRDRLELKAAYWARAGGQRPCPGEDSVALLGAARSEHQKSQ